MTGDEELEQPRRTFTKAEAAEIVRLVSSGEELTHEVAARYRCRPSEIYRLVQKAQAREAGLE